MTPQTGFELTGQWTSLAEENQLLQTIATQTDAQLSIAGHTVNGLPIHRIDIGSGHDQTMLIVTLQHGNEPASREAALSQLRDFAYSTEPETVDYLSTHRIVYLPTVNADGLPTRRINANLVDPNRDYYKITQPETRVVTQVIKDTKPHMIVDAHEFFGTGSDDWLGFPGGLPATHPGIAELEQSCFDTAIQDMTGMGYQADYYYPAGMPRAGLSVAAGTHHAVGMLSETRAAGDPQDRVFIQRRILDMFQQWHAENAPACTQASQASRLWAQETTDVYPLTGGEYLGRETPELLDISGYLLEEELPEIYADILGIQSTPNGFVPLNQPSRGIIPMLLDAESMDVIAQASRVAREPAREPLPPGKLSQHFVQAQGRRHVVTEIRHRVNGLTHNVLMPE